MCATLPGNARVTSALCSLQKLMSVLCTAELPCPHYHASRCTHAWACRTVKSPDSKKLYSVLQRGPLLLPHKLYHIWLGLAGIAPPSYGLWSLQPSYHWYMCHTIPDQLCWDVPTHIWPWTLIGTFLPPCVHSVPHLPGLAVVAIQQAPYYHCCMYHIHLGH